MAERAQPPFPERIGRYEVLLPIASGGMGTVYLARATGIAGFEREVALKLMHSHLRENPEFARDLIEEAKLTVRIQHSNVVSVVDVGEDPFGVYLVMDYVEGDTLSGLQKRAIASFGESLPVRYGLKLLLDALAGLHFAHELKDARGTPTNLVHRDFSPQNILVGVDGIGRLTDFGIAKAATRIGDTATGIIKGKIAYMAPEQARGAKIDRRTDVWAAGVVAWQLIAGRKLYGGAENEMSTLLRIASEPPPRLRDVNPNVPAAFDEVVAKALAMDGEQRWPTAHAFKHALASACVAARETADTDEVAVFTARAVGPMIAERHARVAEVARLRAKVVRLAGRAVAISPTSTPNLPMTEVEQTETNVAATRFAPLVVPSAHNPMGITRIDATSVTAGVTPTSPRTWALAVYGGVTVALVTGIVIGISFTSRRAPAPAVATQPASTSPVAPATGIAQATGIAPVDLAPRSAALATERANVTSAAPPALPSAAVRSTTPSHRPKLPATSSTSVLPRSPYEERP